jgi:hypothetical protein
MNSTADRRLKALEARITPKMPARVFHSSRTMIGPSPIWWKRSRWRMTSGRKTISL